MNVDGDDVALELVSEMASEKRYIFGFISSSRVNLLRRAKVTAPLACVRERVRRTRVCAQFTYPRRNEKQSIYMHRAPDMDLIGT